MSPPVLDYEEWSATCDTLHAHTQVLGKIAVAVAPHQPQLQHSALRLTARGWETAPLPAPDGSGVFGVTLDLHTHEALVERADGRGRRVPLTPHRPVGEVTRAVLDAVRELAGAIEINPKPQEVPWETPLDQDAEHATYEPKHVAAYLDMATRAALVLEDVRAPWRGRATPVNAWWGSFDLAVSLFSGRPAEPPSQGFIARNSADAEQIAVGWWPGDARYPHAAFFGYAYPPQPSLSSLDVAPGRWDDSMGEFLLDWSDVAAAPDPHGTAVGFARSVTRSCAAACGWDPVLAGTLDGRPPPVS